VGGLETTPSTDERRRMKGKRSVIEEGLGGRWGSEDKDGKSLGGSNLTQTSFNAGGGNQETKTGGIAAGQRQEKFSCRTSFPS